LIIDLFAKRTAWDKHPEDSDPPILGDALASYFIATDARNGEILWQHGDCANENPISPEKSFIEEVLVPFPEINHHMDTKYKKNTKKDKMDQSYPSVDF